MCVLPSLAAGSGFGVRKARLLPPECCCVRLPKPCAPTITPTLPWVRLAGGGCGVGCPSSSTTDHTTAGRCWAAPGTAHHSVHHCWTREQPLKRAEHRLGLYSPSWRLFPAPGRVGSCSRIKGEAIILPWLTNELKGKSSGLHNTRYSGWDIGLGTPQWLPKGSLPPGELRPTPAKQAQAGAVRAQGGTHNPRSHRSMGSGWGLLFPHTGSLSDSRTGTSGDEVIVTVLLQSSNHHVQFLQCHFSRARLCCLG